ncbi:DUF2569 family protein [Flagellimonas taeanensis]|uniref:DUF3857 domain-containing protein n=1 Tax=Flagellimonas taeanensis TaxID=1005926 RepID=UPI000E680AB1|nr:DUF3857 domain-containing protein [Allomuricauda taeanensis]RIV52806.1 DUF2569 family protein [Allomuricauda taeanensis]
MTKNYGCFLALFLILSQVYSQKIEKLPPPYWVEPIQVENHDNKSENGAYKYLLLDFQYNIETEEAYDHYAIQVFNSEGIQEFSDISISYDPTYQSLVFNSINVLRNGQKIDKLIESNINTFQRETNLERSLYDGSITAVVNLTDIRKNDIIEYSYTVKGFNPINQGNFSTVFYQQYTSPVDRIYNRAISPKKTPIYYKLLNNAPAPTINESATHIAYVWDVDGTDYFQYDINVPYWANYQKRASISTFKDWETLTELVQPLYTISSEKLTGPWDKGSNEEETILDLIRFVQDDVRYLGFESGIGAYKPHNPSKVLQQRYGDCKDKSLLLVNLLQNAGITSYPFLVNTESGESLGDLLPGLNLFNHCIVYFEHGNKSYYVDPTMTNQGGDLDNLTLPQYGEGLLLKPDSDALTRIPKNQIVPKVKVEETITTDSIGGNALFLLKTTYTGSKADYMRDYFKSNTQESINNEFVNYYSSIYPSIQSAQPIVFSDDDRGNRNEVVIEEYYNIPDFWIKDEDTGIFTCETQPLVLQNLINYTNSPQRTMPYYLGEPYKFEQETSIALPDYWNILDSEFSSEKESYRYSKNVRAVGRTIVVKHNYHLKQNFIDPSLVTTFLKDHEKINDQIAYQLSHTGDASAGESGVSTTSIIISLVLLALFIFGAKKIHDNYNPKPQSDQNLNIGGWLVLPGIGLVLSPFLLLFQVGSQGYFDKGVWSLFKNAGYENANALTLFLGFELAMNIALLVFAALLIILYFKKRTSLPKLIIIMYASSFVIPILDLVLYNALFPKDLLDAADDQETYTQIFRGFISAAIWIPYFLVSERVKNTFTKVRETEIGEEVVQA